MRETKLKSVRLRRSLVSGGVISISAIAGYAVVSAGTGALDTLERVSVGTLCVCLGLALINYALRSLRWSLLAEKLSVSSGAAEDALIYVSGFPMGMTPGKVGEVVRLWLMRRSGGHRYVETAPLVIADRAYDLIALLVFVLLGFGALSGFAWVGLAAAAAVLAGAVLMFGYPAILRHSLKFAYARVRKFPRLFVRLIQVSRAFERLGSWRVGLVASVLSLLGWAAEIEILRLAANALGLSLNFREAALVFASSMVLGALAIVPGGLGVADVSMAGLLTAFGGDLATVTGITIIVRACTLWFSVLFGLIVLPFALWRSTRLEAMRLARAAA